MVVAKVVLFPLWSNVIVVIPFPVRRACIMVFNVVVVYCPSGTMMLVVEAVVLLVIENVLFPRFAEIL